MKQAFRANFLEKADALARWLTKHRKGGKTDLPSKMKELDYWKDETKAETSGQKNLFAQAGTPSGEGRASTSNGGADLKKMARTLSTRFQEVIDLVRSNQEMTDERLDVLEKLIMKQYESDSWNRSVHLFFGFTLCIGGLVTLILKLY